MNVLIVNWKDPLDPAAGGAEEYVRRVAELWAGSQNTVSMLVPGVAGLPRRQQINDVQYIREGTRRTIFRVARSFLRQHHSEYDHVIESVSTRPFFLHRIVGDRATAVWYQIAADVWTQEFPAPVALLGRHVVEPVWLRRMRRARVVTISASSVADLRSRGISPLAVIPPAVETPVHLEPRALIGPPRLVFLGRLNRTKRPDHAVKAFRQLQQALPGATLDIIGRGYMSSRLEKMSGDGVKVHGFLDEDSKSSILSAAHVMLVPGTREGFGIVALEAAARGVPVVAYDIPGLRDAVVDGRTGVLTAPDPREMATVATALLDSPGRWATMSAAAHERARAFTWPRTADHLMAVCSAGDRNVSMLAQPYGLQPPVEAPVRR